MKLKICAMLLGFILTLTAFAVPPIAEAQEADSTLHLISRNRGSASDPKDNAILNAIAEKTGLTLEWELWAANDYAAQCAILIASGDYPDAMEYWCTTYPVELEQLARDGVLMPLDDLLSEYGPNIRKNRTDELYFKSDGDIYAVPCRINKYYSDSVVAIREDWLKQLGLEVPTTSEELYTVYETIMTRKDELVGPGNPLYAYGTWENLGFLLDIFSSENGFARNWNVVDGECTYFVNAEGYRQSLLTARTFFQAGFVEPEYVLLTRDEAFSKLYQNQYASWNFYIGDMDTVQGPFGSAYANSVPEAEMTPVFPFEDANGKAHIVGSKSTQMFVVFSETEREKAVNAVKLLDFLVSEEGQWLTYMGIEGEHYTLAENGTVDVANLSDEDKIAMGYRVYDLICHADPYSPAYDPTVLGYAARYAEIGSLVPVDNTATDAYMEFGAALSDLITMSEAKLITTGDIDFDAVFDEYVASWNTQGGAKWTEEINARYRAD